MSYDNDWEPRPRPGTPQPGQGYPPSQYDLDNQSKSKSGGRTLLWVIGILVAVGFTGIAVCCGVGFFGWTMVRQELSNQIRQQIADSPEIAEHVGDVETVTINLTATQQAAEPGKMIFDIQGSSGAAQLAVDMSGLERPDQAEAFVLILADGERIPLTGLSGTAEQIERQPPSEATVPAPAPEVAPPGEVDAPVEVDVPAEVDAPAENAAQRGRISIPLA